MIRFAVVAVLLIAVTACRVEVIAPDKAAVITLDGSFICLAGQRCEIPVDSFDVQLTLYAAPEPGYAFVKWSDEERHLCAGSTEPGCDIDTTGLDAGNPTVQDLIASDARVYIQPVLEPTEDGGDYIWMYEGWPDGDPPEDSL